LTASTSHLIAAHGGELIDLITQPERAVELKAHSREWPSWDLTGRQICDLELLMNGGFSPLRGFMTRADYEGVTGRRDRVAKLVVLARVRCLEIGEL